MASPADTIAERMATVSSGLPLSKPVLIGVFGPPSDRRALVRSPRGRVTRHSVGDRLLGGRILRIEGSSVMIDTGRGMKQLFVGEPG